jgi:hypothetical protein
MAASSSHCNPREQIVQQIVELIAEIQQIERGMERVREEKTGLCAKRLQLLQQAAEVSLLFEDKAKQATFRGYNQFTQLFAIMKHAAEKTPDNVVESLKQDESFMRIHNETKALDEHCSEANMYKNAFIGALQEVDINTQAGIVCDHLLSGGEEEVAKLNQLKNDLGTDLRK